MPSSCNTSFEKIILDPSQFRNSHEIRTSQSLSSVMNGPDLSFLKKMWETAVRSYLFTTTPSPFLPEVLTEQFAQYLGKMGPFLAERAALQNSVAECVYEVSSAHCFAAVPAVFFSEAFALGENLQKHTDVDSLSDCLDFIDLTIFNKISQKWQTFMGASYDLESIKHELNELHEAVAALKHSGLVLEVNYVEKLFGLVRAQRRLRNIQQVHERLSLIGAVKVAQPTVQSLLATEHYAKATHLILKTQQTLGSKLNGVVSVKHEKHQLDGIKDLVVKMIEEELQKFVLDTVVHSVFGRAEKLVNLLKQDETAVLSVFPTFFDRPRAEDLIVNKLNTGTLQFSLSELQNEVSAQLRIEFKNLLMLLRVVRTDEHSKWGNISHSHFLIVLRAFKFMCFAMFKKIQALGTVILEKVASEALQDEYWAVKEALVQEETAKPLVDQLSCFEETMFSLFTDKLCRLIDKRKALIWTSELAEIGEIYREAREFSEFYFDYFHSRRTISITSQLVNDEKEYLAQFHDKKTKEIDAILEGEA